MNIEVSPKEWILTNRIGFNDEIYKTFNREKYPLKDKIKGCVCNDDICEENHNTISLFPHQRILRDYIQFDSPYRGILAYHELGSGKSAASIAAAEGFIEKRKIFVLTPASLAKNYENELLKISTLGLNMKKSWTKIKIDSKNKSKELYDKLKTYGITSKIIKEQMVWIPLYNNDIENVKIVVEKINYKKVLETDKKLIDETILHIIKNRYTFISYNGLTQKMITEMGSNVFDNSFVIIDEIHNLISRIVNGSRLSRAIYNNLMQAENCKMVLLSGTPIINNPYEIATLINLIRGPMCIYNLKLLTKSIEPTNEMLKEHLQNSEYMKYIDYIYYNGIDKTISIALLPNNYMRKENNDIKLIKSSWKYTTSKLLDDIIKSLNKIENLRIGVKINKVHYYSLPNDKEGFNSLFIDNTNEEEPEIKNEDLFERRILGTLSYYKTTGSEFFPKQSPIKIQYLNMTDHQLNIYDEVRAKERAMDNANKMRGGDLFTSKSSVYRAFSRMVCNFSFPENIKRLFPQDIKKQLKKEIDFTNDDNEDEEDDKKVDKNKVQIEYENTLNAAMKELVDGNYLSRENLLNKYSPKYAKMLEDIDESPGSILIYSQFRTIEGLGIFSSVLNKEEYKEIIIIKSEGEYKIEDLSIFDEKYDNKRYVVFNNDREKTNILMNLFNGEFSLLNNNIYNSLPDRIKSNDKIQLYGKLVKIMMITQSGAEGISLKNVRRVLIMEYFWNSVRINQVIGRAVRTCSHELLPVNQRNVQIFAYIIKLTKEQLKRNFTIRSLDKGITTDEHILNIATNKENIINQFLNMLKKSSFDCIINSEKNKPLENGYKCYNWPINVDKNKLSYTNNIEQDYKILKYKRYQKIRKNKGKVVMINKIKYVEINSKIYDYNSYKNAGILISANI